MSEFDHKRPVAIAFSFGVVGATGESAAEEASALNLDEQPIRSAFVLAGLATTTLGVVVIAAALAAVGAYLRVAVSLAAFPFRVTRWALQNTVGRLVQWWKTRDCE